VSGDDAAVVPPVAARRGGRPAGRGRGALPRAGLQRRWVAALAVVLLLGGAALATVARPAREVSATAPAAGPAPLLVLDASALEGLDGPGGAVTVRATGSGPVLVAAGTAADVAAWAEGAATTTVARTGAGGALVAATSEGEPQVLDPAGSDLWTAQAAGTGSAELSTRPTTGAPLAVLVAADGATPAPTAVELVWTERPVPVLAWVLLGGGVLLALLAARGLRRPARREPVVVDLPQTRPATGPVTGPVTGPESVTARSPGPETPAHEDPARPDGAEPVLLRRPRGSERRRDRRSLR